MTATTTEDYPISFFGAFCSGKLKTIVKCHWVCIYENERASFCHVFFFFFNYNVKVKYRLSTDYDQKKEIFLKI